MTKRWTVLLYVAGDNNLETFGERDLAELKTTGSTEHVNLVAQFDTMGDGATRRYHLTSGPPLPSDVVSTLEEANTGDPAALLDFVRWGLACYPAERVALVLWNHGLGWKDRDIYAEGVLPAADAPRSLVRGVTNRRIGQALFASSIRRALDYPAAVRGLLYDDTSKDFLDNSELAEVLGQIATERGSPLDLLGFDACLMNMIEVATEVAPAARYMVGSQEIEPANGWPYQHLARRLAAAPEAPADQVASRIVQDYCSYYRDHPPGAGVTQSALRLDAIPGLAAATAELAEALLARLDDRTFFQLTLLPAIRAAQKFRDHQYADLGHFARLVAGKTSDVGIRKLAEEVQNRVSSAWFAPAVVAEEHVGSAVEHASGISIYLPLMGTMSPAYDSLAFARQTRWGDFLRAFLSA